jgi:hypothetical protein
MKMIASCRYHVPSILNRTAVLMEKFDQMEGLYMEVSGIMSNTDCAPPTQEDVRLLEEFQNSKVLKEKGAPINWPAFGESPIYEYGGKRVFCMFFPWLYPGENGDFNESRRVDIGFKDWARQQLFMADGRSAKDKTWCFYALNYAKRRRNMTQGQWLVNNLLHSEEIPCIGSLKKNLKNNYTIHWEFTVLCPVCTRLVFILEKQKSRADILDRSSCGTGKWCSIYVRYFVLCRVPLAIY